MQPIRRISISELAAAHLRADLQRGRWGGSLPGVARLAQDLDVSRHTLRAALRQLEAEGLLSGRGLGRSRGITAAGAAAASQRPLRVAILRHDAPFTDNPQTSMVLAEIMHSLEAAGHEVAYCKKSQIELKHNVASLTRLLAETPADAWVVEAGARPLLEWCATQATPCLALYGNTGDLPLARIGPDTVPAFRAATRHLLALGHRRIVLIISATHRKPVPGISARAFLEELVAHGVPTGDYNLPDWEESPEGISRLLENLFKSTPPTALIIEEIPQLFAAVAFLLRRGIQVPGQVSLVSTACDAILDWCHEEFAHMRWDNAGIASRVVRWVEAIRKGKPDRKTNEVPAEFLPGASIGPVWKR
jgi:DNA-binding LacI/PurR family transcriptional regulator